MIPNPYSSQEWEPIAEVEAEAELAAAPEGALEAFVEAALESAKEGSPASAHLAESKDDKALGLGALTSAQVLCEECRPGGRCSHVRSGPESSGECSTSGELPEELVEVCSPIS